MLRRKALNRKEHKENTRKERKEEKCSASFALNSAYSAVKVYLRNISNSVNWQTGKLV